MNDFLARVASLSDDKRRLLNLLLRREPVERPDLPQRYEPPRTDLERTLVDIWSRVLGIDGVGVDDHFIELGGDSILAIQVLAMARDAGIEITATQLFATPTIAGLAAALAGDTAPVSATT
jgi:aryl carrier-like protein